jgi:uncharacterized protein (DUF58 family)
LIYPRRRAILLAAAMAPLALLVGVLVPQYWFAGLAALLFLIALMVLDAASGARSGDVEVGWEGPAAVGVGAPFQIEVEVRFARAAPAECEVAIDASPQLAPPEGLTKALAVAGGRAAAAFALTPVRRGSAELADLWVRWPGMLGLVWKQKKLAVGKSILVLPDISAVGRKGAQMLHRDAMHGLVAQMQLGEGAEFEALAEFHQGMDKRAIDWKQSARHRLLLAKEYRTERNNNIIIALDSGRMMSEPLGGLPKIDRAVSAALLTAYVALKDGDRVSLFGFDSHPRVATKPAAGARSFNLLQQVAAGIEYSDRETNYTLALATLTTGLTRRSLIIIFTDFADTVSAELMLNAVGTLLGRHLVLFVLFRDEELESFTGEEPREPQDVVKAATAAALLRQRKLVVTRLRRLGIHIVEAGRDEVGPALVNAYVGLKRRNLL